MTTVPAWQPVAIVVAWVLIDELLRRIAYTDS